MMQKNDAKKRLQTHLQSSIIGAELHLCFFKKEPQIKTALTMKYPYETVDALGFAPIGWDEPYRVFMTKDPLGEYGDVNLYRAMNNNAVNWIDPLGQSGLPGAILGGIGGAVGGYTSGMIRGDGSTTGAVFGGLVGGVAGAVVGIVNPLAGSATGEAIGAIVGGCFGGATGGIVSGAIDHNLSWSGVGTGALMGTLTGTVAAPGVALATSAGPLGTAVMGATGGIMGDTVGATAMGVYNRYHGK